jgi:ferritin
MMNEKIEKAYNEQINAETFSAYLYWSVAAYFESIGLSGFSQWMRAQAQEEMLHASKFFNAILERGGKVELTEIEGPDTDWDSPLAAFEAAYAHEQYITGRINDLMDLAIEQGDHASKSLLQWFVDEQVEEEDSVLEIVDQLKLIGDEGRGLLMLDRELGARVFTPPPPEAE